jgi:hypothetical protein
MLYRHGADGLLWIESHGGPLILLDKQWLPSWRGYPNPTLPFAESGNDYARACAIDTLLGSLAVGSGYALVLGDEPLATAWCPQPERDGGIIIRWRFAPGEAVIVAALSQLMSVVWESSILALHLPSGQAVLFDAAYSGEDIEASLSLYLAPGLYHVDSAEYAPDPETGLLLHRFALDTNAQPPSPCQSPGP